MTFFPTRTPTTRARSSEPLTSSPLESTPRINQVRRRRHRPGIQQVPARIRHLHRQVHRDRGRPRRVQRTRHERGRHPTIRSRVRRRVRRPTPQPARPGPAAPLLRAPPLHPRPPARAHEAQRRRRRRPGRSRCALAASPGPRSRRGGQALSPSRHGRLPRDPAYAPHRAHRHRGLHRLEDGVSERRTHPVRRDVRSDVDAARLRQTSGATRGSHTGQRGETGDGEGPDRAGKRRGLATVPRARQVRRGQAGDARRALPRRGD